MTRRAQHRGNRPAALFNFADPEHGEVEPEEVRDNPLTRPCPPPPRGCGSPIAQPCTRGSRFHGRVRISGYHEARQQPTAPAPRDPEPEANPVRVCPGCGTGWPDEALVEADCHLRRSVAAIDGDPALVELVERRDPDQITCCPLCGGYL